jgi:LacI family transcriptional regulator
MRGPEGVKGNGGRTVAGKRASIRDVAALSGVSLTTVSHVLNDVGHARVAEETRVRVREAAEQLSYRPSKMARGLRMQQTQTLGLISDSIATTPYAFEMILGAQEAALTRGWTLLLLNTEADPEAERRAIREIVDHQAEGVIYASMYHRVVELPTELRGIPTVLLDAECDDPRIPSVVPDEYGGARTAVEHLIAQGHQRIGFVNNRDDIPATRARLRAYRDALEAAGLQADDSLVAEGRPASDGGYQAASHLLDLHRDQARPSALFCFNDRMAMGAYRAAAEITLRVPADLSIIGFDNQSEIAEGLYPQLTTIALPHYKMGAWAVQTLVERIARPTARRKANYPLVMECPLVLRESVSEPGC